MTLVATLHRAGYLQVVVYSNSDWRGNNQDHKYNLLQKATLFLVSTRGTLFIIIHFAWA